MKFLKQHKRSLIVWLVGVLLFVWAAVNEKQGFVEIVLVFGIGGFLYFWTEFKKSLNIKHHETIIKQADIKVNDEFILGDGGHYRIVALPTPAQNTEKQVLYAPCTGQSRLMTVGLDILEMHVVSVDGEHIPINDGRNKKYKFR